MKVGIIGTGAYSLALALNISKNSHYIAMWSESEEKINEWKKTHNLKSIAEDCKLPHSIIVTGSLKDTVESADAIIIACGSKYVSQIAEDMKEFYTKDKPICIATKGLDDNKCEVFSKVLKSILKTNNIAVISGPTFAVDIMHNDPVALAMAATNKTTYETFEKILSNDRLKLRKSSNIVGVQICGSVKNIIAIASGILAGLGYSESTTAFLINESLHEIKKMIKCLGGNPKTILSFAGVGDLLMTCMSQKSRNYSFGYVIGHDKNKEATKEFLKTHTVEGYNTLKTIITYNAKHHINIELFHLINNIVDGKAKPEELVTYLINKK